MASRWKQHADELADPARGVHVTVQYQTQGGDAGSWSRWTEADSMDEPAVAASDHVRTFKRVRSVYTISVSPHVGRTRA